MEGTLAEQCIGVRDCVGGGEQGLYIIQSCRCYLWEVYGHPEAMR